VKRIVILIAGSIAAGAVAQAPARTGPSFREARTQSAEMLAGRLLGASGRLVSEVRRPDANQRYFSSLEFASAPRSAGFEGVCEADTFWVSLGTSPRRTGPEIDRPTYVTGLSNNFLFRIVGTAEELASRGDPDTGDANWAKLKSACARAGPVLGGEQGRAADVFFFGGLADGREFRPVDAYFAARTLALALVRTRAGLKPGCAGDPAEPSDDLCADPAAAVRGVDLGRLRYVGVESCKDRPGEKCVQALFDRGATIGWTQRRLVVEVATDARVTDPPPRELGIRSIRVTAETTDGH
jgi:hypothetical protein